MSRFEHTYCSQCGGEFGPGDEGYSRCADHPRAEQEITRAIASASLASDLILSVREYGMACADELPESQARWLDDVGERIEKIQQDAYAEGRKDEREDRSRAALDVLAERERQVTAEGYTPEHDDDHHYPAELARAAICYADVEGVLSQEDHDRIWPWESGAWKPKHARRDLVRATALLLAAIESGDRGGWLDSGEAP